MFSSPPSSSHHYRLLTHPVAPSLMQPKFTSRAGTPVPVGVGRPSQRPSLLRLPTTVPGIGRLGRQEAQSATSLAILENAEVLAHLSLEAARNSAEPGVSLIRGFRATIPSSELSKQRRRTMRGELVDGDLGGDKLGLRKLGERARGLLTEGGHTSDGEQEQDGPGRKSRRRRKMRESQRNSREAYIASNLHLEDLLKAADEIAQDKDNLYVRQVRHPLSEKSVC